MSWSKLKQQLESFLSPSLSGKVEYRATGYRYLPDKAGLCYIAVDKKNVFNMKDATTGIRWYQTELEIKNDPSIQIAVSEAELDVIRQESDGKIPEERLLVIARGRKQGQCAKSIYTAQTALSKSNFVTVANRFLSLSIEESIDSDDILLNILAIIDRRVGKKRLQNLRQQIKQKHPIVQYFYELRLYS